jgi:Protein of unknown function (DUF1579)
LTLRRCAALTLQRLNEPRGICLTFPVCRAENRRMNTSLRFLTILSVALLVSPVFAQGTSPSPAVASSPVSVTTAPASASTTAQPSAADMEKMMQQMMELNKPGENQKLLADLAGNWTYTIKFWMNPDPSAKPEESKGTATRKAVFDGRYFQLDVTGKMQMPGPDGKKKDFTFKGTSIEGYDNVAKKFVSTWADNMSTGIMMSEGTYDPATKTFTYTSETEMMPGMKTKIREVIKIVDKDHHMLEWYENRGGAEAKTMEINYTRKK